MKNYLLCAVALAALAGTALAQQPPAPPQPVGAAAPAPDRALPPPPGAPVPAINRDAPPPPPPGGPEDHAGLPPHGHRPPPPPPSKAAHFRIENGQTKIDIKCADDEPMKACSDTLLEVINRLNGPAHP